MCSIAPRRRSWTDGSVFQRSSSGLDVTPLLPSSGLAPCGALSRHRPSPPVSMLPLLAESGIMPCANPKAEPCMSLEFLVTSLIVVASPGTGVLYTLATGLSRGSRASVVAAFGCTVGIVPHMAAAILGLAALLHTSALAFQTFQYLGGAHLLYMALDTPRERGPLRGGEGRGSPSS